MGGKGEHTKEMNQRKYEEEKQSSFVVSFRMICIIFYTISSFLGHFSKEKTLLSTVCLSGAAFCFKYVFRLATIMTDVFLDLSLLLM